MIKICSHADCIRELKLMQQGGTLRSMLMHEQGDGDSDYDEGNDLAVICIVNKDAEVPPEIRAYAKKLLPLVFDDVDFVDDTYVRPEVEQIAKAIKFSKKHENLIVSCHGGMSRSAALAFVIECTRVAHPKLAMGLWDRKKHHPNRRVIRLGGEILARPEMEACLDTWMQRT
jgi:predicted protein tyrosine phosphatase